ncbi:MAG: ankyrin repeat domain-containing protein, partial [Chlamydiia bacterium]|nr:ankyrin repeat domain-containing protein [Chlamydiia bacterium]
MAFITSEVSITRDNVSSISQMAARIPTGCQRLKLSIVHTIDTSGKSRFLSGDEFKPIAEKIATLPGLIKIVFKISQVISWCNPDGSDASGYEKRNLEYHPMRYSSGVNDADDETVEMLKSLFSACTNIRALSIKGYPLCPKLIKPLAEFVEDSSLAVLKISHQLFRMRNNDYHSLAGYPSGCDKHIFNDRFAEEFPDYSKERCYKSRSKEHPSRLEAAKMLLAGAFQSKSLETFAVFGCYNLSQFGRSNKYETINEAGQAIPDFNKPDINRIELDSRQQGLDEYFSAKDLGLDENTMLASRLRHVHILSPWIINFQTLLQSFDCLERLNERFLSFTWTAYDDLSYCVYKSDETMQFLGDKIRLPKKLYGDKPAEQDLTSKIKSLFYLAEFTKGEPSQNCNRVEEALREGLSVNVWDGNMDTALHRAAKEGNLFMVNFLRKRKALITHNKQYQTPIDLAQGHDNAAEILKALGVDPSKSQIPLQTSNAVDPQL